MSSSSKRKFEWILENVTREKLENQKFDFYSDPIYINLYDNKTEWIVQIVSAKKDETSYIGVYLHLGEQKADRYGFNTRFSIALGSKSSSFTRSCNEAWRITGWGWRNFIELDEIFNPTLKNIDENSRLRIIGEIDLFYPNKKLKLKLNETFLLKQYNDTEFADFTLKSSDGVDFPIHRVILADRYEFFRKMFTIGMKEKNAQSVTFEDIDSVTLKEVLKFIYTGKVELGDYKMAKNVLYAAEKFDIPLLKSFCVKTLADKVKKENVLEILEAADMFNAKKLEDTCLQFIINNYKDLKEQITDGWNLRNISLVMKIMDLLITSRDLPQFTLKSSL